MEKESSTKGDRVEEGEAPESESGKHDHYSKWDPMRGMAESFLNAIDTETSTGVLGGGDGGDMELSAILCPFNDGSGRCYKASCPYKHVPYSSKVLKELPKLQASAASTQQKSHIAATSLPAQILPASGCISKVVIVAAFDPGCFYVIPENGWRCLCDIHEGEEDEYDEKTGADLDSETRPKQPKNFFDSLEGIQTSLRANFQILSKINQRLDFNVGELVAVRMSSTGGKRSWFRAKVVEDSVTYDDDNIFKPVDVHLQLLDYGVHCIKSSLDIAVLSENLCRITPLAYKCQLFGVSPILANWSSAAKQAFRELVLERSIIAEVVRTGTPTFCNNGNDGTCEVCLLNLYVKSAEDNYIDVTQHLISRGFGLEWNMFPAHSYLNDVLEGRVHKFALTTQNLSFQFHRNPN